MHYFKILFFLLFPVLMMNAQKFELGKVSLKELQEKSYPADTSAVAAILYNKAKTYFRYDRNNGFTAYHEYEFRIKIYKKEGLKWANFEVPYYVGYENLNNDYVKFSNGITYNIENGEIAKAKLNSEGSFRQDVNELWKVASITMPNVKVGSVIEFRYTLRSEDLMEFPVFHFQYAIPVAFAEYRTEIPEFFIYKPSVIGLGDVKSDAKIVGGYQNYSNEHQQSVNLSYQQINSVYTAQNMPALNEEDYVDNIENYRSSVVHELEKTRFPDVPEKNYSTTWEGVAKTIYKDKRFGKELEERLYFEQDLASIIKNATTNAEKVTAIFEFVKRSMHWDGKYGYYTKKGVR
ncbi:MAG TPA: DUF3857 domain-containing protein, partial [Flavobacterium sp.]|nr:DUF3857 domain-containing protein [Flavobacterium sp.]